jgi:ATP-dependent DNA helicase RecG
MTNPAVPPFHPRAGTAPMVMDPAEFRSHFSAESDYVERKRGLGVREIGRALVAFSNTDGGVLLIGVADHGEILGRAATQGTIDTIHEAALATHDPGRYWIQQLLVGDTAITVVSVDRRMQGFSQTSDGQVLVRRGARSVPLLGGDLQRFLSDRALQKFDVIDSGVDVGEVDEGLLARVGEAWGWRTDYESNLVAARLATPVGDGEHLTIAGALALLPAPERVMGKSFIEVLRFPADGEEYDRRVELAGPVEDQVVRATQFVLDELGTDVVVSGLRRYELPRLPEVVLREAIANAVAHRTYEDVGRAIRIELRSDEVVLISPGGLPEPVTEQNIRETQAARNATVLELLRRFRLAEDLGKGVDRIQDSMAEELLDPPRFEDLGHSVRVSLPIHGTISPQERAWVQEVERRGVIQPTDKVLLVHAARGEELTNARVREVLGVDSRDARLMLQRLRKAGLLEQIGERGGTVYVLAGSLGAPISFRMTPRDLRAFILKLAESAPLTNARVRAETGLDRVEALRILESLVRDGQLERTGERRGTRYVVSDHSL